jgi:uncharacterized cupin superfamily protein
MHEQKDEQLVIGFPSLQQKGANEVQFHFGDILTFPGGGAPLSIVRARARAAGKRIAVGEPVRHIQFAKRDRLIHRKRQGRVVW